MNLSVHTSAGCDGEGRFTLPRGWIAKQVLLARRGMEADTATGKTVTRSLRKRFHPVDKSPRGFLEGVGGVVIL